MKAIRYYKGIAKAIHKHIEVVENDVIFVIIGSICDFFKRNNPNFNEDEFRNICYNGDG